MFHPDIISFKWENGSDSQSGSTMLKGPFAIVEQPDFTWLSVQFYRLVYCSACQNNQEWASDRT